MNGRQLEALQYSMLVGRTICLPTSFGHSTESRLRWDWDLRKVVSCHSRMSRTRCQFSPPVLEHQPLPVIDQLHRRIQIHPPTILLQQPSYRGLTRATTHNSVHAETTMRANSFQHRRSPEHTPAPTPKPPPQLTSGITLAFGC